MHALTFHGGRLDEAARRYPHAPLPWIDLSTGINPLPWHGQAPPVDLHALPSPAALDALARAAAGAFGAPEIALTALPGSEIGLRLLACLDLPRPFHLVAPGYRSHQSALPGATVVRIDTIADLARHGGTLLLANPNNPDGRLLAPEHLRSLARTLAAQGGLLIVDEAFADAVDGASILPLLTPQDRVLVLRSFGKFYGLAGVRLGFACGAADLVARIAELLGSWPVSATALALGTAAYRDGAWQARTRATLIATAARLDRLLAAHGLAPHGDCPLFRLIESEGAASRFERLAHAGILTRPFDYAPDWLRIGLPADDAAFARLDAALGHG
ncbi:aminotransferase class I/II-fold pyridoxal phosphate-dependent enzyme [Sphingomonas sp. S2-65]|uniref:aminotransferase class I/II-fold pyridoxal phosphate-dependent enzyme n=1 Tax=Sphingomonas sp. S2-65 TaxID=2903960 RepID=UPI001F239FD1|nr:aminotransferase class I/II-fold pyridoxal phosphate-dependent enzyme [Sphingomonas sp. S2-65]UYY59216.1 aminotransferase class I/II-fold pyridoxal phosphate-dependent enzyme [Sphingomonas sp. S2-65]